MLETGKFSCSATEMLEKLNFPRFEVSEREDRMHFWQVTDEQLHLLMDPMVGDAVSNNLDLKNLTFYNATFFYILCKTLVPIACPRQIEGVIRKTMYVNM